MANAQVQKKLMTIGQAAKAAGVSTQTVEYYLMVGLLTPIKCPPSPRRFFDAALVRRIRLIRELNQNGYALREIRLTWLRRR